MEKNRNELIPIGTSSTKVSESKEVDKRTSLTIINSSTGTERITISVDKEAVDLNGRVIYPGGQWQISTDSLRYPTQRAVFCVCDQASGQISFSETYGED